MTWDVAVHTAGEYEVEILQTCPEDAVGSILEIGFNGATLKGTIASGWDSPLYTHQDTIPRPAAESQMKEFRPLPLDRFHLEEGRGLLTLRAVTIPGRSVMDVRQLNLTLIY